MVDNTAVRESEVLEEMKHGQLQAVKVQRTFSEVQRNCLLSEQLEQYHTLAEWVLWWKGLEEPPRESRVAKVVQDSKFEALCMCVILTNTAYTYFETNYGIQNLEAGKTELMKIAELTFLVCYTAELAIRLFVHRCFFFINDDMNWNLFDVTLVVSGFTELILNAIMEKSDSYVNTAFIRMIRLVKLVKIFRMIRILRFFSELRTMLNCVLGSFMSMFWSFFMLAGFTVIFAIVLVQQLTTFLLGHPVGKPASFYDDINTNFGSVESAIFTLFCGISGGDWTVYFAAVSETGWFNSAIFLCYVIFVWLSVTNIITSIFIDKAMRIAQPEVDQLLLWKVKEDLESAQELKDLFIEMDLNQSGTISWEEFEICMKDLRLASLLQVKGLDIHDAKMFYRMLESIAGHHEVDLDSFVCGCLKMKGHALNIDLLQLNYETKIISRTQHRNYEQLKSELVQIKEMLQLPRNA